MKNSICILLVLISQCLLLPAQQWDWAVDVKPAGIDNDGGASGFTHDSLGNLYYLVSSNNFFHNSKGFTDSIIDTGVYNNIYIVKANRNGEQLWKSPLPAGLITTAGICVAGDAVYVAAAHNQRSGSVTFGSSVLPAIPIGGKNKALLLKYNTSGTPLEAITLYRSLSSILINSFYIVNDTQVVAFANLGLKAMEFVNGQISPKIDYIKKDWIVLSSVLDGKLLWYKNVGFEDAISERRMTVRNKHIYLGAPTTTEEKPNILIIYKISLDGIVTDSCILQSILPFWTKNMLMTIHVDGAGNILVSGQLNDTFFIGPKIFPVPTGSNTPFLAKFDANLQLLWLWKPPPRTFVPGRNTCTIYTDRLNDIYWPLAFLDSISIDGQLFNGNKSSSFNAHSVILKFNPQGTVIDNISFKDTSSLWIKEILPDYKGNFYVSGVYGDYDTVGKAALAFDRFHFKVRANDNLGYFYAKYRANKLDIEKNIFCKYDSLKATADTVYKSFTWIIDDTIKLTGNAIRPVFANTGKHTIKLFAYESDSTESEKLDSFTYYRPVEAGLSLSENVKCRYTDVIFKDSSIFDNLPDDTVIATYIFGDGKDTTVKFNVNTQRPSIGHGYADTGTFKINYIIRYKSCIDTLKNPVYIRIIDAPQPGILLSKPTGCNPFTVDVKRKFLDTITQIIYSPGDGNAEVSPAIINSTDGQAQFSYINPGNYWLVQTLTGPTGCVTKDSVQVNVLAGFEAGKQPLLRFATVVDDKEVLLEWDTFANTKSYIVSRSLNKTGWKDIATISDETVQQFTDASVNPKHVRYFYKLTALDTCENQAESNLASTILLTGRTEKNDYSVIEWTPYEDWPFGIKEYSLEIKDNSNSWITLASTGNLSYKDDNFSEGTSNEKCYRVTALSNDVYASSSNTLCLPFQPVLLIPNSFTPNNDLLNDTYFITTLGITELKINIYNTWGELLFTCDGPGCSWDGTYKGKPCPTGVYTYLIRARTNENKLVNTTGQITLVK